MPNESNVITLNYELSLANDTTLYVKLSGRIVDTDSSTELLQSISNGLNETVKKVVVDMAGIDYINSNGLNTLIAILTKTRNRGGEVILIAINEKIQKLMLITKLNTVFTIMNTKEEALNHFATA
jgi:anti-sigma B factor antagonist